MYFDRRAEEVTEFKVPLQSWGEGFRLRARG